MSKVAIKSIDC